MGIFFDTILINPMLNVLVVLYSGLFENFGLSIIVFTIIVPAGHAAPPDEADAPDEVDANAAA